MRDGLARAISEPVSAESARTCHTCVAPEIAMIVSARYPMNAAASIAMMILRRSKRSASTPAGIDRNSIGRSIATGMRVTMSGEPVISWMSQLLVMSWTQNAVKLSRPAIQNRR